MLTEETKERFRSAEGMVAGTPGYMSPEQATGGKVDARSDIFAFGSLLYEMVTGRRAFAAGSRAETLEAVLHLQPQPPRAVVAELPSDLEKLPRSQRGRRAARPAAAHERGLQRARPV
jgi:serine/threonine-protein kinase